MRADRERELLEACNRYLGRARDAEARAAKMETALEKISAQAVCLALAVDSNELEAMLKSVLETSEAALADRGCAYTAIEQAVNTLVALCHGASVRAGWWHDLKTGEALFNAPRIVSEKLALVHSEVSEAMEANRKGLMDDKLPHRPGFEVELGDALIRICDLAGSQGADLGGATAEKFRFNETRPDHKPEARLAAGGKTC